MNGRAVEQRDAAGEAGASAEARRLLSVFYGPWSEGLRASSLALAMLLTGSAPAADCAPTKAGTPPTLVVQVMDDLRLPLPGAVVVARLHGEAAECVRSATDAEGGARLAPSRPGSYDVEASMIGFKTKRGRPSRGEADLRKGLPHLQS